MALYDKASLVLIPSGTKAGTVYSQKPTSGDGDFDFTRSTYATRVNSQGLIEKERSNLLLQSNNFDTTWTRTSVSTPTGGQTGYDGSNDAWLLEATGTSARLVQNNTTSGVQTFSCYAKAGTANYLAFYNILTSGDAPRAWFNLSNGTIENENNEINANIESVGSGWYRCSLTYNATLSNVRIYVAVTAGTFSDTSSGDNIYIQDTQLEQGLVATDYIETTTSAVYTGITDNVPRLDYDGDCPSLLLEPQRTNLIDNSEYIDDWSIYASSVTLTPNYIESPEGVQNGYRVQRNAVTYARFDKTLSGTSAQTYTFSVFVKGDDVLKLRIDAPADIGEAYINCSTGATTNSSLDPMDSISSISYGNGWYRFICEKTYSNAPTIARVYVMDSVGGESNTNPADVQVYGLQLEAGSYATSYIPTYGTSVTRAAETNSVTGISDLIGQTEGTWFLDYVYLGLEAVNQNWFALQDTSGSDRILFYSSGNTSELRFLFAANGSTLIDNSSVIAETSGTRYKVAVSYKSGAISIYINGNEIASYNTAFTFGNEVSLFTFKQSNQQPAARVNQTLLLKTALTDTELADLTT